MNQKLFCPGCQHMVSRIAVTAVLKRLLKFLTQIFRSLSEWRNRKLQTREQVIEIPADSSLICKKRQRFSDRRHNAHADFSERGNVRAVADTKPDQLVEAVLICRGQILKIPKKQGSALSLKHRSPLPENHISLFLSGQSLTRHIEKWTSAPASAVVNALRNHAFLRSRLPGEHNRML